MIRESDRPPTLEASAATTLQSHKAIRGRPYAGGIGHNSRIDPTALEHESSRYDAARFAAHCIRYERGRHDSTQERRSTSAFSRA
jgi:hypothetical protein